MPTVSLAQSLQNLDNQPPDGAGIGFLLTDGTVIFQGNGESDWVKLTPDNFGSYVHGTWKQIASLPAGYVPDAFASAVLADGRVIIEGGEYNNNVFAFTNLGAVYDPVKDTWTKQKPPDGWGFIGDSPSAVLPNGKFLLGSKFDKRIAELDPATLTWTNLSDAGKNDRNAEEGWTLLPDGSVLTYDVTKAPHSERYIESEQKWVSAGSTIVDLHSPTDIHGCIPYGKHNCFTLLGRWGLGSYGPMGRCLLPVRIRRTGERGTPLSMIRPLTSGPSVRTFPTGIMRAIRLQCCFRMGLYWSRVILELCTISTEHI